MLKITTHVVVLEKPEDRGRKYIKVENKFLLRFRLFLSELNLAPPPLSLDAK